MSGFEKPKLPSSDGRKLLGGDAAKSIVTADQIRRNFEQRKPRGSRLLGLSDATGSMATLWNATKRHIQEMIRRLAALGPVRLRWVAYRDYSEGADVLAASAWEETAAPLLGFLDGIACFGGGDFEEAVERALKFAAEDAEATRVILIGDAPPHPQGDYVAQARRLGELKRPVFSFVVGDHAETKRTFAEIARLTGGKSTRLTSVEDLLDLVVLTAAEEMGGRSGVEEYLKKYAPMLSDNAREYGRMLLGDGRGG